MRKGEDGEMKYEKELYIDSQIFAGDMDGSESNFSEKIVKTRKPHECCVCGKEIPKGIEVVNLLLLKETEISNKIHHAITEIMRLGYATERGKLQVQDMTDSIFYSLDDLKSILNRDAVSDKPPLLSENPPKAVSESHETVSKPEETEQKGRKRIDIGKIMALKNAR